MQRSAEADSTARPRSDHLHKERGEIRYRVVHSSGERVLGTLSAARDALRKLPGARVFLVKGGDGATA